LKPVFVAFAERKLEREFESLKTGRYPEPLLYEEILKAIVALKSSPLSGAKIQKRLWPKGYIREYGITNLWKYDLREGWRLIYTIKEDEIRILNVILEWFNHADYERRFKY